MLKALGEFAVVLIIVARREEKKQESVAAAEWVMPRHLSLLTSLVVGLVAAVVVEKEARVDLTSMKQSNQVLGCLGPLVVSMRGSEGVSPHVEMAKQLPPPAFRQQEQPGQLRQLVVMLLEVQGWHERCW